MDGSKLEAMLAVVVPCPDTFNVFARRDGCGTSDNSHQITMTTDFYPEYAEAAFGTVKRYPFN